MCSSFFFFSFFICVCFGYFLARIVNSSLFYINRFGKWTIVLPPTKYVHKKKILRSGCRATLNFRKFKVALKSLRRSFVNFAKSCILTCQSLFNNKKWGSLDSFLSYKHLKGKLRVNRRIEKVHVTNSAFAIYAKIFKSMFFTFHLDKYSSLLLFSILCFFPHSFAHSMECKKH